MAKFVKIQLNPIHEQDRKQVWRLIIDNEADLFRYAKLDNNLNTTAYITQNMDTHPRGRAMNMNSLLKVRTIFKTGIINPLVELNGIFKMKIEGMLKSIRENKVLCINYEGGYCFLDGFLESHHGVILETIEKSDLGFPIEDEVINADVLVLENDNTHVSYKISQYFKQNNITEYKVILSLKETDMNYVVKAIKNANTVALHSEFNDTEQVNSFMNLFLNLGRKNIIISTYETYHLGQGFDIITNHPLYNQCAEKHNITFVKTLN